MEKDGFLNELLDLSLGLWGFGDDLTLIFCFFVEISKNLSGDTLSTILLFHFLFLFLSDFPLVLQPLFFGLLLLIRIDSTGEFLI